MQLSLKTAAVVLAAAIGAAFGDLAYSAIAQSLLKPSAWLQFIVAAPLMYLGSLGLFKPLQKLLRLGAGLPATTEHVQPRERGLVALLAGALALLAFIEFNLANLVTADPGLVLLKLLTSIVLVGGITLAWAVGARTGLPLAAPLGFAAGLVANSVLTILILKAHLGDAVSWEVLLPAALGSGAGVGIVGFAGGLTIDLRLRQPAVCAPLAALAAFAATGIIGTALASTSIVAALPNLLLGIGWLLGLSSSSYADEVLSRDRRPPT